MNHSHIAVLCGLLLCAGLSVCSAQLPNLAPDFDTYEPVIPPLPFRLDTLFFEDIHQAYSLAGPVGPAKGKHDYIGLVKQNPGAYSLFVSHEITNTMDSLLGDGGGVTAFKVSYDGSNWGVVSRSGGRKYFALDFGPVGGTNRNCGGALTPKGTILTAEEDFPLDNEDIHDGGTGIQDTSDWVIPAGNGIFSGVTLKRFENYGYMSEIDPKTGKVLRKLYAMGRFKHESAICLPNGKDVLLIEDDFPSLIYRFEADVAHDYRFGQLYAYKQIAGGGGSWIELPRSLDSLLNVHKWAVRKGATLFLNLEWITNVPGFNDKLFISESGRDFAPIRFAINAGGTLAEHLLPLDTLYGNAADSSLIDYYGRILALDLDNLDIDVYLEGGTSPTDPSLNLSNPDALTGVRISGQQFLVIQEDINGASYNRMPAGPHLYNNVCEVYMLPLMANPTLDDLHRVFIGPRGAEIAGATFTADGNTMFINIQHPFSDNTPPYHKSGTVAVTGFKEYIDSVLRLAEEETENDFAVFPDPSTGLIYFDEPSDVEIFNLEGRLLRKARQVTEIDLSDLPAATYILRDGKDQSTVRIVH